MASNIQQSIVRINEGIIWLRIYVLLHLNEFKVNVFFFTKKRRHGNFFTHKKIIWQVFKIPDGCWISSVIGIFLKKSFIIFHILDEIVMFFLRLNLSNGIDQSHGYRRPQAACHEQAGSYDKTTRTAICFEHKTQYILIRAPYTRIVVFWHISKIPPVISQSEISCNTPMFYIAAIFVKYCYTTGSWLL